MAVERLPFELAKPSNDNYVTQASEIGYKDGSAEDILNIVSGGEQVIQDSITLVEGYFIGVSGNKASNTDFFYSQPIPAVGGCEYTFFGRGYNQNVAMISECASDGTSIVPKVASLNSNAGYYKYTPINDCYLIVSGKITGPHTLSHTVSEGTGLIGDVEELKESVEELEEDFSSTLSKVEELDTIVNGGESETVVDTINKITDKFITAAGTIGDISNFFYSQPIHAIAGAQYTFHAKGYNQNVAMISECASDGTNIVVKVISTDSTLKDYTYTPDTDCYLIVSGKDEGTPTLSHHISSRDGLVDDVAALSNTVLELQEEVSTTQENVDDLQDNIEILDSTINGESTIIQDSITQEDGYFVNFNGIKSVSENFFYSQPIQAVAGCEYTFNAKGYGTNVAMISECSSDGSNIVPKVISIDSTPREYKYTPSSNCYLIVSANKTVTHTLSHKVITQEGILDTLNDIQNAVNDNLYKINGLTLSVFEKIGIVGDSYASGVVYINSSGGDSGNTYRNLSWGKQLARMRGFECNLFTRGGYTTKSFIESADFGLSVLLAADPQQLYILALGINDAASSGGVPVGSISDIGTENNTYYRNYAYIISAIKNHAPNAKIVISTTATNPITGKTYSDYNAAVVDLADYFDIVCIDQMSDGFFSSEPYIGMVNYHPTAVAYGGMALAIERLICKSFVKDYNYWKDYRG